MKCYACVEMHMGNRTLCFLKPDFLYINFLFLKNRVIALVKTEAEHGVMSTLLFKKQYV